MPNQSAADRQVCARPTEVSSPTEHTESARALATIHWTPIPAPLYSHLVLHYKETEDTGPPDNGTESSGSLLRDPEDEDSDGYDGEEYDVEAHEQGQGDIPKFYTYEEGLSYLTAEGQDTLEMLPQSVSSQYNMAGVQTEDSVRDYEDSMEVDTTPGVARQFEDADIDH
ncbi:Methylosome subunit pICln [Heterocephalus glaber]|uniref:Methylosome subunit pICln n=1 Tax=Heterocephalus glaber TaxID=10181 RepID=G5AT35_HETGA|nr:Methylosome subunit pICln [Heterocephalus glaber]